jgi:hypothetical protein
MLDPRLTSIVRKIRDFLVRGIVVIALVARTVPSGAEEFGRPASFRNAAKHEDLLDAYQRSTREDPIREMGEVPAELDLAQLYAQTSLLERSDPLSQGNLATLLPKGALLFVPEGMAERAQLPQGAEIVDWGHFYRLNSHWILPWNIRLEQALGEEALDLALFERLKRMGKVVVAICMDHPISLREGALAAPAEENKSE